MSAKHASGRLCVHMFGAPRLILDGRPFILKAPPRTLPLLFSLLLEPKAADGRNRTAAALWPDVDIARARKNLRRHLSYLRRAFNAVGIAAPGLSELEIAGDVVSWTDVGAFDQLARVGSSDATALYCAPLLSSYEDEEWLAPHRARLRRTYIDLIVRLIESDWMAGRLSDAFARAEEALAIEPFAEELVQAALRLSMEIDEGRAGLSLFDRFAARLKSEFDEEPQSDTLSLVDRLKRRSSLVALPVQIDSFFGRDADIMELARQLQTRHSIALYGPPGIGQDPARGRLGIL